MIHCGLRSQPGAAHVVQRSRVWLGFQRVGPNSCQLAYLMNDGPCLFHHLVVDTGRRSCFNPKTVQIVLRTLMCRRLCGPGLVFDVDSQQQHRKGRKLRRTKTGQINELIYFYFLFPNKTISVESKNCENQSR